MENKKSGITFIGLLQVTFIVLKIVGVIAWSWVWVLAPFWAGLIIEVLVAVLMVRLEKNKKW